MTDPCDGMCLRHRLLVELVALGLSFRFHGKNSFVRKWATIIFFLTWSITTIGMATGHAVEVWAYAGMTALVFYIIGREHEAEIHRLFLR